MDGPDIWATLRRQDPLVSNARYPSGWLHIPLRWATWQGQSAGSVTVRWSLRDAARLKRIDLITSREFISIVAPQPDHLKDMWYK